MTRKNKLKRKKGKGMGGVGHASDSQGGGGGNLQSKKGKMMVFFPHEERMGIWGHSKGTNGQMAVDSKYDTLVVGSSASGAEVW